MRQIILQRAATAAYLIMLSSTALAAGTLAIPSLEPKPVIAGNRTIYMNGTDISSARNQDLRNVHIKIDEHGNLFITAPHYQVTEEETFTPLSSYKHATSRLEHKPAEPRETGLPLTEPKLGGDSALAAPVPVSPARDPAAANAPSLPATSKTP